MKFEELCIGDWFTDGTAEYVNTLVFIKTAEDTAYGINCSFSFFDTFLPDREVNYCSQFIVKFDDCVRAPITDYATVEFQAQPFMFEDFDGADFRSLTHFNDIPMDAIYKGKGQVYYKRISTNQTLVIWSVNPATIGKIFERDDWETHDGTYSICHNAWFKCREDADAQFPNYA